MLRILKIHCFETVWSILFKRYARIFTAEVSREGICCVFYVSVVHTFKQE